MLGRWQKQMDLSLSFGELGFLFVAQHSLCSTAVIIEWNNFHCLMMVADEMVQPVEEALFRPKKFLSVALDCVRVSFHFDGPDVCLILTRGVLILSPKQTIHKVN